MTQIYAYIGFNGQCREAMGFYKECLGGDLTFLTFGEGPMAGQCPAGMEGQIMHSSLTKGPLLLMATDMTIPNEGFLKGNHMALSLNCSSEEEINHFFSSLSAGGQVVDSLGVKFWGAIFGVLTDKFGIRWMLNYDKNQQ